MTASICVGEQIYVEGKTYLGTKRYRYKFHWFSLNGKSSDGQTVEFPAGTFSGEQIEGIDQVRQLVDPELAGATDIIGNERTAGPNVQE